MASRLNYEGKASGIFSLLSVTLCEALLLFNDQIKEVGSEAALLVGEVSFQTAALSGQNTRA